MMDFKNNGDLDGQLDLQALLDKYLPDEEEKTADFSYDSSDLKNENDEEAQFSSDLFADHDFSEDEKFFIGDGETDAENSDIPFVLFEGQDEEETETVYDRSEGLSDEVEEDEELYGEACEADEPYGEPSEEEYDEDADGGAINTADTVLDLDNEELVLDEEIIAELMASDDAQFGGIEGFENIEDLSGYDSGVDEAELASKIAESFVQTEVPEQNEITYDEEYSEPDKEEYESGEKTYEDEYAEFVNETMDELEANKTGNTDMDLIVALGLEDELHKHFGEKKASRLKKNYEKEVAIREERDKKTLHDEFRDHAQTGEISSKYKKAYFSSKIKILISAVFALLLLIYENLPLVGLQLGSFLDPAVYPVVYVMIDLQILLLCSAAVYDQVFYGFKKLFTGKPVPESILSVTLLLAVIYSAIVAKTTVPPSEPNLFNFPVAFCAFMTSVYSYLSLKREIFSFNVISSKKPKYALRRLSASEALMESAAFGGDDGEEDGDVLKIEKVSFVDGYFYRTESTASSSRTVIVMCMFLSFILAVLFGAYSMMMDHTLVESICMGYTAFVVCVPVSLLFNYSYPFFKANSASYDIDSTIIGESSLEEYSGASIISFDDKLVFPSVGVKVQNIKVYNNYRFDRVLYYAASVFTKTGGPLSDVFEIATIEMGYSDDVLLTGIGEGYIQTEVNGKSIIFGKAEELIELGIDIPDEIIGEDDEESDDISVMYMVFKGKIVAKMNILYSLDSDFEFIVKQLAGSGMSVCVKTLDPNINEEMIKSRVKLDKYPMHVVRYASLEEVAYEAEKAESGVVARGSSKGLLETVTYCDKVLEAKKANSFICLLQTIVSIVILAIVLLTGNMSSFRSFFAVLAQAFWLIPMGLTTKALLR